MTLLRSPEPRDLFPGALEMMVLQSLRREPMHGYALVQHIRQRSNELLQVEEGSLYPALQRLEMQGWVQSEWRTTPNHRRARYYRLTAAGRKQLGVEISSFERMVAAIGRVMRTA